MSAVGQYIISVITAATILTISTSLLKENGSITSLLTKLIAGLFLLITVLSPIIQIKIPELSEYLVIIDADASEFVTQGNRSTQLELASIIKEQSKAYILEEATKLGVNISLDVILSEELTPIPVSAVISGKISPYAKQKLSQIIANDLGISKENQLWK